MKPLLRLLLHPKYGTIAFLVLLAAGYVIVISALSHCSPTRDMDDERDYSPSGLR